MCAGGGLCVEVRVWVCFGAFLCVRVFVFLFVLVLVCFWLCVFVCPLCGLCVFPPFGCVLRFRFLLCFLVRFLVF